MSCGWSVDGWTDTSMKLITLLCSSKDVLMPLPRCYWFWLNADCSRLLQYYMYQDFFFSCDRLWSVAVSRLKRSQSKHWLCPLSPGSLIDRPGQFIGHCDSFLYSQGRRGEMERYADKVLRNTVHNTYCVLIAGWTVTSRMFSTYLLVCVWACLLFDMHVLLPSLFPQWLLENYKPKAEMLENKRKYQWILW